MTNGNGSTRMSVFLPEFAQYRIIYYRGYIFVNLCARRDGLVKRLDCA